MTGLGSYSKNIAMLIHMNGEETSFNATGHPDDQQHVDDDGTPGTSTFKFVYPLSIPKWILTEVQNQITAEVGKYAKKWRLQHTR